MARPPGSGRRIELDGGFNPQPKLLPDAIHARLDLGAHLNPARPAPAVAFLRQLGGSIDPDLAAKRVRVRRVIELVDRALGQLDVMGPVDIA